MGTSFLFVLWGALGMTCSAFSVSSAGSTSAQVIASADGRLPRVMTKSLSPASSSLIDKIELLFGVESQKCFKNIYDEDERLVKLLNQSLTDGGFKLMDQRDLDLCSAMNSEYLLRLSLLPDLKGLEPIGEEFFGNGTQESLIFEGGKVLVFRRGHSQEVSNGRLLLPKLDYLQASLVQRTSSALLKPLGRLERKLEREIYTLAEKMSDWIQTSYEEILQFCRSFILEMIENFGLTENDFVMDRVQANEFLNNSKIPPKLNSTVEVAETFLERGVRRSRLLKLSRYRTSSSAIVSELDDALEPFLLRQDGTCRYDDELGIAGPKALLQRVSIQNTVDVLSGKGRRELIRNYFKPSTLVEPSYEEVLVLWRPSRQKPKRQVKPPKWMYEVADIFDVADRLPNRTSSAVVEDHGPLPLEIRAYTDVPLANIGAVLPKTKLIFRPQDAVVFDLVSLVSFFAVAGSLRFDSPKLDIIAVASLSFFALRTFFRYSNKLARYDLLVNRFLTGKITHRNEGALKYVVSEANSNRALRAMVLRDWLSSTSVVKLNNQTQTSEEAALHINKLHGSNSTWIDVDVTSGICDLESLGLIDRLGVKSEQESQTVLKQIWNEALP
mmetsp:Transcript_16138/g.35633  ORF Transcript_16138/g.35633 Transcript_16138/m.35633 type:complete len:612 (-) Transcript_16138:61-1896(-)